MHRQSLSRWFSHYGMALVLLLLCAYFAWATLQEQQLVGGPAAQATAAQILRGTRPASVLIVATASSEDQQFAQALEQRLGAEGIASVQRVEAQPPVVRKMCQTLIDAGAPPQTIAATESAAVWLPNVLQRFPQLKTVPLLIPGRYRWPTFLKSENLLNVANQIVVIAVIAVGMTLVIITGGIDLSVGSLVALSAVMSGLLIRDCGGGAQAGTRALILCCLGGIGACTVMGLFSGAMVMLFGVPPFIATLGMMQVASGLAYIFSAGQSIYDMPATFTWLGRGTSVLGLPNAVLLMLLIYALAHVLMGRTRLGRHIYAVGGNAEAARLSGVRVGRVLLIVYGLCGAMAGLGGVIVASQLKSSSPTYGLSYELYVITAVVVGGTSLAGGSGKVLGTLIGALIIAVIQNGMNLTGVESYRQKVVLGMVILGAVLLDRLKKRTWRLPGFLKGPGQTPVRPKSMEPAKQPG